MGIIDILKMDIRDLKDIRDKDVKEVKENKNDRIIEKIAQKLGYPYKLLPEMTPGKLTEFYRSEFERGRREGFTPLVIAGDRYLSEYIDTTFDIENYDVKSELENISDECELMTMTLQDMFEEEPDFDYEEFMGNIEGGEAINYFMSVFEFGKMAKMTPCALLEIPTLNPWETVVYAPFGGWNACPAPADMAAMCRQWYEKYGAVPAVITHDTLEFVLDKPVSVKEAEALAVRQYLFCNDRVDQGTANGTAGELADSLTKSKIWYFWWD
ncbi:MAG: DUF4253 domain-containing protein [Firmicutes bacterium]|nr:DUF4253 domain-containing protein [Bacillota bacterium]